MCYYKLYNVFGIFEIIFLWLGIKFIVFFNLIWKLEGVFLENC